MTITIRPASQTDTKLKGYYVGQINGVTVCCCRGAKNTRDNLDYLASLPVHMLNAMIRQKQAA